MNALLHKLKVVIIRDDLDLSGKWWHRLFKVAFVISIIAITIYLVTYTANSYDTVINKWNYVESLSTRLHNPDHTGKVFSITQLYSSDEVISTFDKVYSYDRYSPSLGAKDFLFPMSAMFLISKDNKFKSFCSDDLYNQVETISQSENIKNFSPTNPSFGSLYTDIKVFKDYLRSNSYGISCLSANSYTLDNEDGSSRVYTFLEPIETYDYIIYKYQNGIWDLILLIILEIVALIVYVAAMLLIYHKILLYIIFGPKNKMSQI